MVGGGVRMLGSELAMDPAYDEHIPVPRAARLPIELRPPDGFDAPDIRTWPRVVGRLEFVDGRLLYMPPCGDEQQVLVAQVCHLLRRWAEKHSRFDVGGGEAGMVLGLDVRGADAAVWPRPPPGTKRSRAFRRTPPILAVEVAGRDDAEDERALRDKAAWYLRHGVQSVWLVLPELREVVVVRAGSEGRLASGALFDEPALPGLSLAVDELFSVL